MFWPFKYSRNKDNGIIKHKSFYPDITSYVGHELIVEYMANDAISIKKGFLLPHPTDSSFRLSSSKESSHFYMLFWDNYNQKVISIRSKTTGEYVFGLESKIKEED